VGPGAEEAEVVAAGEGKRRESGRERRDTPSFFIYFEKLCETVKE
jgi:hypothetical protein